METIHNCNSIKDSLVGYLQREMEVADFKGKCVITLPIKTLDDRYLSIFVEEKYSGYYLVHDGGKSIAELFAQGISVTDHKKAFLATMAKRFDVSLVDGIFEMGCQTNDLQNAILAVGQCASLAMYDVVGHTPFVEEEPLAAKVERSLRKWKPESVRSIERHVEVKGRVSTHHFDFVSYPNDSKPIIALKILSPTYSANFQAERYGFLVLDIEKTHYDGWRRVAVLSKVELWHQAALNLVGSLSRQVVRVASGRESEVEGSVPRAMNILLT